MREPYVECAQMGYDLSDWPLVFYMSKQALKIREKSPSYVNMGYAWDHTPDDLCAIAAYRLGLYEQSLAHARTALALSPGQSAAAKQREDDRRKDDKKGQVVLRRMRCRRRTFKGQHTHWILENSTKGVKRRDFGFSAPTNPILETIKRRETRPPLEVSPEGKEQSTFFENDDKHSCHYSPYKRFRIDC